MADITVVVEEEMELIKQDARYKLRAYYEASRNILSMEYIKSLSRLGFYLYMTIIACICVVLCIIIYMFFKGSKEAKIRLFIGTVFLIITFIAARFIIPE